MRRLYRLLLVSFLLAGITVLHIGISYLLAHPWDKINIVFGIIIIFLVHTNSRAAIWMTLAVFYIIELYAITPFGIQVFAATISTLLAYWIHQYVIADRRWYSVFALAALSILMYRMLYIPLFLLSTPIDIPAGALGDLAIQCVWEIVLTSLFTIALYGMVRLPHLIGSKYSNTYAKI